MLFALLPLVYSEAKVLSVHFYEGKKAQIGAPKAITATAHKIARIFYNMLKHGTGYIDLGQEYYEQRYQDRVITNLKRKAKLTVPKVLIKFVVYRTPFAV